jgi:hypothetical protein
MSILGFVANPDSPFVSAVQEARKKAGKLARPALARLIDEGTILRIGENSDHPASAEAARETLEQIAVDSTHPSRRRAAGYLEILPMPTVDDGLCATAFTRLQFDKE